MTVDPSQVWPVAVLVIVAVAVAVWLIVEDYQ